jgi:pimeloyl-ACP methyl ester carboxylesterase
MKTSDTDFVEIQIPTPWGYIAAKTYGNPSGPPVLAVHGWMDNAGTFDKLVPLLSKSLYVVAVDLPGHGLSSHIPTGLPYNYTQDSLIALKRITNYFKWSRFSWLGHSMGAGLGVLYASVFPSQVERLIMLDLTKPITGDRGQGYADQMANGVEKFLAMEEKIQPIPPTYGFKEAVDRLVAATYGSLTEESAKMLMIRGAKQVGEDQWAFTRDLRLRNPSILRFSHEQMFQILENIRCEILLVKAKKAPWFEPEDLCRQAMDIYQRNCASYEFWEVDGNHFVHLNEAEKIADKINQFLIKSVEKSGL